MLVGQGWRWQNISKAEGQVSRKQRAGGILNVTLSYIKSTVSGFPWTKTSCSRLSKEATEPKASGPEVPSSRSTEQCTCASHSQAPAATSGASLRPRATCCSFHGHAALPSHRRPLGKCSRCHSICMQTCDSRSLNAFLFFTAQAITLSSKKSISCSQLHSIARDQAARSEPHINALPFTTLLHGHLHPRIKRCNFNQ